jgi:hypothetical protein
MFSAPSTPVSAVFASRWPRVSVSERHSVELQRHLAVILKRRLSSEQAISFGFGLRWRRAQKGSYAAFDIMASFYDDDDDGFPRRVWKRSEKRRSISPCAITLLLGFQKLGKSPVAVQIHRLYFKAARVLFPIAPCISNIVS